MKTWQRRTLVGIVTLAAVLAGAVALGSIAADRKLHRRLDVAVAPVAYATGSAVVDRGRYLYASRGCADCHGADGAGKVVVDDGALHVRAPDITGSPRSVVARYAESDWVRTIRHGVKPNGEPLLVMPSEDYNRLTDADLAAVVAYVRQLAPAEGRPAEMRLPLPMRLAYAAGVVQDAASKIDHTLPPALPVPEGVTLAHGRYVAQSCKGCHGTALEGGKIPGGPPDWPAAARLAAGPGNAVARYASAEAFQAMLKTGRRPDGSVISPVMPFAALGAMNETDVRALYLYLGSPESGR